MEATRTQQRNANIVTGGALPTGLSIKLNKITPVPPLPYEETNKDSQAVFLLRRSRRAAATSVTVAVQKRFHREPFRVTQDELRT